MKIQLLEDMREAAAPYGFTSDKEPAYGFAVDRNGEPIESSHWQSSDFFDGRTFLGTRHPGEDGPNF